MRHNIFNPPPGVSRWFYVYRATPFLLSLVFIALITIASYSLAHHLVNHWIKEYLAQHPQ